MAKRKQATTKKKPEKWIAGAIEKPGALRAQLGIKEGETIPASKLEPKKGDSPTTRKRKVLAKTLRKLRR